MVTVVLHSGNIIYCEVNLIGTFTSSEALNMLLVYYRLSLANAGTYWNSLPAGYMM